jgi:uncharacterized glyoxalase superfamily protein PhnB
LKHVEWLTKAFSVVQKEIHFTDETKTTVSHCRVALNEGTMYMTDHSTVSKHKEGHPHRQCHGATFRLEFPNQKAADDVWKKVLDNEGKVSTELKVQSWGGYHGTAVDPFGYTWAIYSPLDTYSPRQDYD